MKRIFLTLFLAVIASVSFAQDSTKVSGPELVERTNAPSSSIHEKFTVLKSDKKVKQGLFQAFYNEKVLVVSGRYDNGVKSGVWRFCGPDGSMEQAYDYNNHKLIFLKPVTSPKFARYEIDTVTNAADSVIYPVKIGGYFYGYHFMWAANIPSMRSDMRASGKVGKFECLNILTVGGDGKLNRWQIVASNGDFKQLYEIPLAPLGDDDKLFVPASLNGKPMACKIYMQTFLEFGIR